MFLRINLGPLVGHCDGDAAIRQSVFAIAKPYDGFACWKGANVLVDRRAIRTALYN